MSEREDDGQRHRLIEIASWRWPHREGEREWKEAIERERKKGKDGEEKYATEEAGD